MQVSRGSEGVGLFEALSQDHAEGVRHERDYKLVITVADAGC